MFIFMPQLVSDKYSDIDAKPLNWGSVKQQRLLISWMRLPDAEVYLKLILSSQIILDG